MTAKALYCALRNCPLLEELSLEYCTNFSNHGLLSIAQRPLNLKYFSLTVKNQQIETKGAQLISKIAIHSHLKELKLRSCTDISKDTVLRFTGICPDLREINLSNCINNNEDVDIIFRVCDDCQFVKEFKMYHQIVHRKS